METKTYKPCAIGEPLPVRSAVAVVILFLLTLLGQVALELGNGADGNCQVAASNKKVMTSVCP